MGRRVPRGRRHSSSMTINASRVISPHLIPVYFPPVDEFRTRRQPSNVGETLRWIARRRGKVHRKGSIIETARDEWPKYARLLSSTSGGAKLNSSWAA